MIAETHNSQMSDLGSEVALQCNARMYEVNSFL